MEVDKIVNKEYSHVIDICRMLKSHGTTAVLLDNGLVVMEPIIENIRNYAILHTGSLFPRFRKLYINLGEISSVNAKFKKTMSGIRWRTSGDLPCMEILNKDQEPYQIFILQYLEEFLDRTYEKIPGWSEIRQGVLCDEPDDLYTPCEGLAYDLSEKKMCRVIANGNQLMFSKPFLGDTKNTQIIGFRVIKEDPGPEGKITVKFKQKEKLGNIYTYASFLKIPYTGE